jgi:hypothetical protein
LTGRRSRFAAHLLTAIALVLDALALLLLVSQAGSPTLVRFDWTTMGGFVLGATFPVVGWLIATRRPENLIGWIFIGVGLSQALDTFAGQYAAVGLVTAPGSLPVADVVAWIAVWTWAPGFVLLLTYGVLLFPDGHLPSPRWRPVAWLAALSLVLLTVPVALVAWSSRGVDLLTDGPPQSSDPAVSAILSLQLVGLVLLAVAAALSVTGLVVRFRRSVGVERAQLKWFVAAGTVEVALLMGSAFVTIPSALDNVIVVGFVSALLPVAAAIAILRYRLYDIDRVVSRSVSYVVLTALLAALFAGLVVAFQAVLAPFTESSSIAVAGSTLIVAGAFQPVRVRIQRVVDRRFNRARFDADRVASGFSGRIRDQVEVDAVIGALDDAVALTLQPSSAGIWIREGAS